MDFNFGLEFCMVFFRNDFYFGGGINYFKNLFYYDNERNEWIFCEVNMKRGRCGYVMVVVREFIFMIVGRNFKLRLENSFYVLSIVEVYNIRSRKWESIGEVFIVVYFVFFFVMGEKIFIFGGI